jgi:cytochrome b561
MLRNTPTRWGAAAQAFHWVSAALVLYLLGHGWWMTHLAARDNRLAEYATHASVGYFLLALIMIRMVWRWTNEVPLHPPSAPAWERRLAMSVHVTLYVLLLVESYLGWALAGTLRQPLDRTLGGAVRVPQITRPGNRELHELLEGAHEVVAWILAALVVLHIGAAVYHWKVRRDDVLHRMLPGTHGS